MKERQRLRERQRENVKRKVSEIREKDREDRFNKLKENMDLTFIWLYINNRNS